MALTKKTQALEPSLIPRLDGTFDCIWYFKMGSMKRCITSFDTEDKAREFMEKKHCELIIDKIRGWQAQQTFIRYQISETDYMNIKPRLELLGRAIDKLQKIAKDRIGLATLMEEHIIEMIEVCRPGTKSRFRESTDLLIEDLKSYSKRILLKQ